MGYIHQHILKLRQVLGGGAYWVNIHEWDARKATHDCDEFIQIVGSDPRNSGTEHDNEKSEYVLLPFDVRIVLSASREKFIFSDFDSGEDL